MAKRTKPPAKPQPDFMQRMLDRVKPLLVGENVGKNIHKLRPAEWTDERWAEDVDFLWEMAVDQDDCYVIDIEMARLLPDLAEQFKDATLDQRRAFMEGLSIGLGKAAKDG